jgi:hypothetical protein
VGTQPASRIRWLRRAVVLATLAAVISPVLRDRDSAPLSTYPMYASARGREATLATAVGVDVDGATHRLSLSTIGRTDDPLIAESLVAGAIRAGRADALCAEIARRVHGEAVAVEVVEERHDVVDRAAGRPSIDGRTVHAHCDVGPADVAPADVAGGVEAVP